MNRIHRFIIYILAMAVLLSMITVPASAAAAPKDTDELLTALEIFNGTEADKAAAAQIITRADAVYYALRATAHDIVTASSYGFSDVGSQTANANAIQTGLGCGVLAPAENFRPGDAVTAAEFFKMIAAGLGYDSIAQALGNYPEGYMTLARRLNWIDGMGGLSASSTLSYSELATLLKNILMSGYIEQTGLYQYDTSDGENILYRLFKVYQTTGILTANAVTTLNYPDVIGDNRVKIGGVTFNVRSELYASLADNLGYNLNYWIMEDDTTSYDKIICFEDKNTVVDEIFSEDFIGIEDGKLSYEENNRIKTISLPASCAVIYNGKAAVTSVTGDVFKGKWGTVRLVKPTGGSIETVIITAYENYFAGGIDKDNFMVYDNTSNNRFISFKNSNGELCEYAYFRDNTDKRMSFGDITANSVLSVAANDDYFDVIVVKETVAGIAESTYEDEDGYFIVIDSNVYKLAPEMELSRIGNIKVGSTYTFYLDAGLRIAAGIAGSSSSDDMDWAYLIDILEGLDENGECLYFRLLLKNGEIVKVTSSSNIRIDGRSYKNAGLDEIRSLFLADETVIKSQVIRLSVNDGGEINAIDTLNINPAFENDTDRVRQICDNSEKRIYKGGSLTFGTDFAMTGNTVIFKIPDNVSAKADKGNNSEYGVVTNDIWSSDVYYYVSAYNSNIYSQTADVVITTAAGGAVSMDNQQYITVVTSISTVDEDNEVVTQITGIQNNTEYTWYLNDKVERISEDTYLSITDEEKAAGVNTIKIGKGDAIRFDVDMKGRISDIQLIYDCSEQKFVCPTQTSTSSTIGALNSYSKLQLGMVRPYRIYDGYILASINGELEVDDPANTRVISKLSYYKVYEVDMTENTVTIVNASSIHDWYNYGKDNCSYMLMQNRYNEGRTIVIYKY